MREILFRGKRVSDNVWIYGDIHRHKNGKIFIREYGKDCLNSYEVIPETVGQYIGFCDKNGTKIFEGDIFVDKEDEVTSVVKFRNGMFCLVDYGITGALMPYGYDETAGGFGECDCQPMYNYNIDTMKIDGNIYDNHELLEGD